MNKKTTIIIGGLVFGIVVAFCVFVLVIRPRLKNPNTETATRMGVSVDEYQDARVLHQKAQRKEVLSNDEVARLVKLTGDTNKYMRVRGVTALGNVANSPAAEQAVRARLKDDEWLVRQKAVSALTKLRVPDLKETVQPLANDPNTFVREQVQKTMQTASNP